MSYWEAAEPESWMSAIIYKNRQIQPYLDRWQFHKESSAVTRNFSLLRLLSEQWAPAQERQNRYPQCRHHFRTLCYCLNGSVNVHEALSKKNKSFVFDHH